MPIYHSDSTPREVIADLLKRLEPVIIETLENIIIQAGQTSDPNATLQGIVMESLKRMGARLTTLKPNDISNYAGAMIVSGFIAKIADDMTLIVHHDPNQPSRN